MKDAKRFSYRDFQSELFILGIVPIVIYIVNTIKGNEMAWGSTFCGSGIVTVLVILLRSKLQKKDVKDEMAKLNLAKAEKITLFIMIAVIFVSVLLNDYCINGLICKDFCWLTVLGAIAMRSMLFSIFDAPILADEEE